MQELIKNSWVVLLLVMFFDVHAVKQIALTFDDAPRADTELSSTERTAHLLEALASSGVEQAMFFVTTKHVNSSTEAILDQYVDAGHLIANHSDQHSWLHKTSLDVYQQDLLKAHELLKTYQTFKPYFRFPYLDEGRDVVKAQGMIEFLQAQTYKNGYVTVDNYDWYLDSLYQKTLKANQTVNILQLKKLYVDVLWQAIEFSDQIAMKYLGRSPKHVLLLHDNDLAAMFIDDLVAHLKLKGWEIISPLEAYQDPIATQEPKTLFKGQGRVAALAHDAGAKPRDLVHVAEDEEQLLQMFNDYQVAINPSQDMPEWFKQELLAQVGTWQADNAEFQSKDEPFSHYRIEWNWGLGKESITGRLYGIHEGKPTGDFWTFSQYWDASKGQARLLQWGHGGRVGDGYLKPLDNNQIETIQTFSAPDVNAYLERHLSQQMEAGLETTSYGMGSGGEWNKNRSYLWVKQSKGKPD